MGEAAAILVVEEDADIRTLLVGYVQERDFHCITVASVEEARHVLGSECRVVAALIDVACPLRSESLGFARDVAGAGAAVVVTTGHPDCVAEIEASGLEFILKPYDVEALHLAIDQAIRRAAARGERSRGSLAAHGGMTPARGAVPAP